MAEPFHQDLFEVWVRIMYEPCPEELLSGLSDPQQPTIIEVEQEDGSIFKEFSRYWPEGGGGPLTNRRLNANSLVNRYAGLYSGRMKALVQDQLGRGGGVNWGFSYARTHGIYTASDGSIWAIEISASGIFAAPLSLCPFEPEDTVGGFSTRARKFPASSAIAGFTAIEIASAEEVAPAYDGKSALWSECGWAFSDSGAKACNVVVGQPGEYMVAYLYEITITETEHTIGGESVMGPFSASMALIDEDFFWGNRVTHIRVPQYPSENTPQSLVSIDWFRGQIVAPSEDIDTPVHAYYEGETMVVSRYISKVIDAEYVHTDGSTGSSGQQGFQTTVLPTVPVGFAVSGPFTEENNIPDPTTYYALNNSSSSRLERVLGGAIIKQTRTGTWGERSDATTDVLTIPFGDRESVYHARKTFSISEGNASATATYDWTEIHYKASNIGNSHTFERLGGCADNAVLAHPDPIVGGSVVGHIIWDEAQPAPDPLPTGFGADSRFGTKLQENGLSYWHPIFSDCDDMVGGGSPESTGLAAFNKGVAIGEIDDDVWQYGGIVDAALPGVQPGNERFVQRWRVRQCLKSSPGSCNDAFAGQFIRAMPFMYISATSAGVDKRPLYTHASEPISENEEELAFGVALGNSPVNLDIDDELWDELRIYDPSAEDVQRLLVVARDASSAARQLYSEEVYPTMGTPIGTLLAGDDVYPLASITAPMVSWIGKP